MEKKIITFTADEQSLRKTGGIPNYASNKVSYIEAQFELGENWQGFDAVRAIWYNKAQTISMVLADGKCIVPYEVLANKGQVMVNLVGSISENDVLTDRLTTYPVVALIVDADAKVDGSNTQPITPSQFEQFVEAVKEDADRAEQGASDAETYANNAETSADNALLYSQNAEGSAIRASGYALDASSSATSAEGYAQNASESATSAENYANDAEDARDEIRNMSANATTLPAGSSATASYSDGVLSLGIPRGDKGATGAKGDKGDTGATPNLTIGTVTTLDPSESATATITGTDENPVLNLGLPKGEQGEVSFDELSALLPTDTASGDIASFPDGQSIIPAVSVKVDLEPIQDLHGYDKPWAGGGGANQWDEEWEKGNYNASGAKVNSTAIRSANFIPCKPSTDYYLVIGSGSGGRACFYDADKAFISTVTGRNIVISTPPNCYYMTISTATDYADGDGTKYNHDIAINYPSTVTTYSPYSNICPISGHTECVTSVSGVNVWDEVWELGSYDVPTGQKYNDSIHIRCKNLIPVLPNTTYYKKAPNGATYWQIYYDADENYIGYVGVAQNTTFTTPENAHYMAFNTETAYGTTYNHDISINYPSTDHEYHAYDGNTYTTTLGRTVYGGEVEQVGGSLTDKMAMVDLGTLTWQKYGTYSDMDRYVSAGIDSTAKDGETNAICSIYPLKWGANGFSIGGGIAKLSVLTELGQYSSVADFKTAMSGVQLCYELATPQTYQLTPTEVDLLLGQNNLWTDCGSVEVTYKADIERWVNKKINALI